MAKSKGEEQRHNMKLWTFACDVYAAPHVQTACLVLQEQYEADIPLLLFCLWAAQRYGVLPEEHQHIILENTRLWRTYCIQPLRNIRQQMKAINTVDDDSAKVWSTMRDQVKATELQAEKSVLESLETYTNSVLADRLPTSANIQSSLDNIAQYLPLLLDKPDAYPHLASILHASESEIQYDDILNNIQCYKNV